jgi:putative membrane protein
MIRISILGFGLVLLTLAAGAGVANEHPSSSLAVASKAGSGLSSVDYNFVAQANLGAPFQIASGRIAENKATTADIRNYPMVVTHIPVVDDLNAILRRKQIAPPPDTLLRGAYNAMIASLKADAGAALDRDYVEGQVEYQKGNDDLFRYEIRSGTDRDLKKFAERTLRKIDDHLQRALKLAQREQIARAFSQ